MNPNSPLQPTLVQIGSVLDNMTGAACYDPYAYAVGYLATVVRGVAEDHDGCTQRMCLNCVRLRGALAVLAALDLRTARVAGDA